MPFDKDSFFDHVDKNKSTYITRLGEAVAIPSISSNLDVHLPDIQRMVDYTKAHIERLNGKATVYPNPASTKERPLPPILLGEFSSKSEASSLSSSSTPSSSSSKDKKTVCIYGHLDVQPAAKEDGWNTEPFVLTERNGKLFGRGSTDDKGPALGWLWTIEAYQNLGKTFMTFIYLLLVLLVIGVIGYW